MSYEWQESVWSMAGMKLADRLLLLCCADYATHVGKFWPSVATLTRRTGIDRRRLRSMLTRFEANGWIRRLTPREERYGRGKTAEYVLAIPLLTTKGRTCTPHLSSTQPIKGVPVRPFLEKRGVSASGKGGISQSRVIGEALSTEALNTTSNRSDQPPRCFKDILVGPPPLGLT